jgi:uncharacterized membrane protein
MATIDESVVIERPREDVRAFMRDPQNQPMWQANMLEFTKLDEGDPRKGTRYLGVTKVAGRKVEWTAEISEWDEVDFYEMQAIASPVGWHLRFGFDEVPNGTRVTMHQELDPFAGFFGKLADPLVTRMYSRDVKGNLETLKDILESEE